MRMKKITPIILLMIIVLTSFTAGELIIETYSSEFFTGAKQSPKICLCEEKTEEITIRNDAPYPQVFEITTNLERATIPVNQITLRPNQEMNIPITLTAMCEEKPTTEEYDVTITSTTGRQQIIQRELTIKECQTIDAKLYANKNTTNICTPTSYTIQLKNPSTFEEQYLIGPLKNIEWFDERGFEVTLKPKQQSILNFTFIPDCDESGKINNTFRIQANKSNLRAELSHELTITPGYNFTIHGLKEINTCRFETIKKEYTIKNNGLINNTYKINLNKNPDFVSLTQKEIQLEPEESKTIELVLEPGFKTKDQYEFTINVKTQIGNEEIKKDIELNINNCYDATLTIQDPETLTVCQGMQELNITMQNKGNKTEIYELETNTHKATLKDETIILHPEEEKTTQLIINTTEFEDKILFEVNAHSTRELLKHWTDAIVLDVVAQEDCAKISFPARYNVYSRYYEDNVMINVKNTGIQEQTYTIRYEGNDYLELIKNKITIKPDETKTINLNKTREHEQEEYYFKLELETTTGEIYAKEFKLILTGTPITEQIIEYAKENPCFALGLLILTIIILYAIITNTTTLMTIRAKTIISIILLLIIAIMLITQGLPERVNPKIQQAEDPYAFKAYEGEKIKIDLYEYIKDPDEDPLTFTIENEPRYLDLEQEHNKITIHTQNYTGSDRFRITAEDGRGGSTTTPRFNVEVLEKTKLTTKETYEFYCQYINAALLIIALIIVLITKTKTTTQIAKIKKTKKTPLAKTTKTTKKKQPRKTKKTKKNKTKK